MLFTFLLIVHAIIAAILVTVILMQRSEGGGLTSGGSPSGFMSARGAADFLTRSTAILATIFIAMAILLAVLAANQGSGRINQSLVKDAPASTAPATSPAVPVQPAGNETAPLGGVPVQQ